MTDLAFQDYCIICDKLCTSNAVYCSDQCKLNDEINSKNDSQANISNELPDSSIKSPLLTPSSYYHNSNYSHQQSQISQEKYDHEFLINSPIMISLNQSSADLDSNLINLNSKKDSSTLNFLSNPLNSTSNNYRKWLTTATTSL